MMNKFMCNEVNNMFDYVAPKPLEPDTISYCYNAIKTGSNSIVDFKEILSMFKYLIDLNRDWNELEVMNAKKMSFIIKKVYNVDCTKILLIRGGIDGKEIFGSSK